MQMVAGGLVRARRVIVCKPASLLPATAGKGYGLAEICVLGHETQSAFPRKGTSAIDVAAHLTVAIQQLAEAEGQLPDPRFDPPCTTFNVGVMHGGTAKNIIAGDCS